MDTVKLDGEGFAPKVAQGAKVKKGDLLLEFDIAKITGAGYSVDSGYHQQHSRLRRCSSDRCKESCSVGRIDYRFIN